MTLKRHEKSTPSKPVSSLARLRLLYVEDEDLNWEVSVLHLRERYDIDRAKNSEEAFARIKQSTYHGILMDIQLQNSDLDGINIVQVLRGTFKGEVPAYAKGVILPEIPIIFMTAYSARYSRTDLLRVGGDELITKPVDFTSLGLALARCLLKGMR